ncbi:MAG: D-2-hydroxyacid dehydrogenase [Verrucomicrobia bacterium]|nr:D-2-hydroxyacid dehydrogenase [Verrucomicrobiota bacterium]
MRRPSFAEYLITALLCCSFATSTLLGEKVKILVSATFAEGLQPLTEQYPDLELVTFRTSKEALSEIKDAVAVVGLSSGHPAAEFVKAGKNLKWMAHSSAGVEKTLEDPVVRNADFILTNMKIVQGPQIADHAMALLLNFTRDLKHFNRQMKDGFIRQEELPMIELRGKTMLVVGLGGIGTQVAERAFAFGMRVLAVDPKDIPLMRAIEYVGKPDQLNELLAQADVVVNCTPHTPETELMYGPEQFARMKDGVYFINISRGAIVDTDALTAALQSGKVLAAGLDVTDPEPLPSDHPLWSMSNVTITPHVATLSDHRLERFHQAFYENIERFMTGRPLRNVVDKHRRY